MYRLSAIKINIFQGFKSWVVKLTHSLIKWKGMIFRFAKWFKMELGYFLPRIWAFESIIFEVKLSSSNHEVLFSLNSSYVSSLPLSLKNFLHIKPLKSLSLPKMSFDTSGSPVPTISSLLISLFSTIYSNQDDLLIYPLLSASKVLNNKFERK